MIKYSPTQLTMFKACRRKWHFGYPGGFKAPPSASQALGSQIHAEIETALIHGTPPSDERARCGLAVVDDGFDIERDPIGVELDIEIPLPMGADGHERKYVGVIDLFDARDPQKPRVTDHKTTSNIAYAKTKYELKEDVQMLSYAYWALTEAPGAEHAQEVTVCHNNIPTRGAPTAIPVSVDLSRAHVESRWAAFLPVLDEMHASRTLTAADVPADGLTNGECDRFGGCPHRSRCARAIFRTSSPETDLTEVSCETNVATPDKNTNKNTNEPPTERTTNMNAPNPQLADRLAALRAKAAGGAASAAPAAPPTEPGPTDSAVAVDPKARIAALKAKQQAASAPAPANNVPATRAKLDEVSPPPVDMNAKIAALKMKQNGAAPAPTPAAPDPTPAAEAPYVAPAASSARIDTLYINCMPTKGPQATALEDMIAPVLAQITDGTGLSWAVHDFGKGKGYVVDGLQALATLPSRISVDSRTPLGGAVLEALIARANNVVRGVL